MIEVNELTRYYGQKQAISNVSFSVKKGEILGLLGPNAAGKTTTMRILTCYMPPTSGTATVSGYDIFDKSMEIRRITGYLPENPPLYNELVVTDYLNFVAKIKDVKKDKIKSEIDTVIEKLERGEEIEPDNAFYNFKKAIILMTASGERWPQPMHWATPQSPDTTTSAT